MVMDLFVCQSHANMSFGEVFFDLLEVMVIKEGYRSVVGRPVGCRLLPEEAVEGPVLVPEFAGTVGVFLEEDTYAAVLE